MNTNDSQHNTPEPLGLGASDDTTVGASWALQEALGVEWGTALALALTTTTTADAA